jgi:thiamine transport system permease protein
MAGIAVVATVVIVLAVAVVALSGWAGDTALTAERMAYVGALLSFTLLQATLSTAASIGLAIPVALALARRPRLPARQALLWLLTLPMALPQLVAVLGLLTLFGENGWINQAIRVFGDGSAVSIYGLAGIVVAHVFFNLPLATRLLLARLDAVPEDTWRLAASLGIAGRSLLRLVEWPVLAGALPGVALLIFGLATTSFTVVLVLGGGPQAATLEVGIYQALRFDFDPALALSLAGLQVVVSGLMMAMAACWSSPLQLHPGASASVRWTAPHHVPPGPCGIVAIAVTAAFVGLPILAVLLRGFGPALARIAVDPAVARALATSAALALSSAILSVGMALALTLASQRARHRLLAAMFDLTGRLPVVLPVALLGAGWFVALAVTGTAAQFAPAVVVGIGAILALPFAATIVAPALALHNAANDRLAASLGIAGWRRFAVVDWPALRRPLALAAAYAGLVSFGDLAVISYFGSESLVTLPYLLYQQLGSYRSDDAAAIALVLLLLAVGLLAAIRRLEQGSGR